MDSLISVFKAPVRRGVLGPFVVALTLSANQGPSAQEALSPGVMFARSPLPTPGATASGEPDREAIRAVENAFNDTVLPQTGLVDPTVIRFAPDGRMFVAEKSGRIKVFDNVDDPSSVLVADLHVNVYNFWDRGLLGMALDPELPGRAAPLRPLHLRRRAGRQRAALGHRVVGGPLSDPAGPDHERLRRDRPPESNRYRQSGRLAARS